MDRAASFYLADPGSSPGGDATAKSRALDFTGPISRVVKPARFTPIPAGRAPDPGLRPDGSSIGRIGRPALTFWSFVSPTCPGVAGGVESRHAGAPNTPPQREGATRGSAGWSLLMCLNGIAGVAPGPATSLCRRRLRPQTRPKFPRRRPQSAGPGSAPRSWLHRAANPSFVGSRRTGHVRALQRICNGLYLRAWENPNNASAGGYSSMVEPQPSKLRRIT